MRCPYIRLTIALTITIFCATTASAGLIFVTDISNPGDVIGITGFMTNGNEMEGMKVTTTFSTGSPESVDWQGFSGGAGGATGTTWDLVQSGDTFDQPWTLTTLTGQSDILSVKI